MPEQRCYHTDDDGESGEVPAEGRSTCHWEWNVKAGANGSIEHERDGTTKGAENNTVNCLTPVSY